LRTDQVIPAVRALTGFVVCSTLILGPQPRAYGNDSAASTAAGGIRLKREASISMEKERLSISPEKVTVEYEFLNQTDQDITTEVAFPIPPFDFEFDDPGGPRSFDDFHVWVEGQNVEYQTDARATINKVDYTSLLKKLGVDINSFGHFDWGSNGKDPFAQDIVRLSAGDQDVLAKAGLVDSKSKWPKWTVSKTYHWNQIFPAHKMIHVRHEYKPVVGFEPTPIGDFDPNLRKARLAEAKNKVQAYPNQADPKDWGAMAYIALSKRIDDACIDPSLQRRLAELGTEEKSRDAGKFKGPPEPYAEAVWLDYILTTANSWKTPIKEFELVVEKSKPADLVSFCWDGPVVRVDADHFAAKLANFVPTKELQVLFLFLPRD